MCVVSMTFLSANARVSEHLCWYFQTAARQVTELENVDANIKRRLNALAAEKEQITNLLFV